MKPMFAIAVAVLVVASGRGAWAQPADPKAQSADAKAQPADAKAQGEAAAAEGGVLFQKYQYAAAIERFKAAYGLDPDPGYLFNIAQSYRLSGDCTNAADYYDQFLGKVPNPPNLDKIMAWAAQQRECARLRAEQGATPVVEPPHAVVVTPPPARASVDSDPGRSKRHLAIGLAGAGVAALAVAGFFTWDAHYLGSERDKLVGPSGRCTALDPCDAADVNDYDQRGSRANTIALTSYVVGGAALVGSVALFLMARSNGEAPVAVVPSQGGAMMVGGFEF